MERQSNAPFFNRPPFEDIADMDLDFQYTKPSIPQARPHGPSKGPNSARSSVEPNIHHPAQRHYPTPSGTLDVAQKGGLHDKDVDAVVESYEEPEIVSGELIQRRDSTRSGSLEAAQQNELHSGTFDATAGTFEEVEIISSDQSDSSVELLDGKTHGQDLKMGGNRASPILPVNTVATPPRGRTSPRPGTGLLAKPTLSKSVLNIRQKAMAQASSPIIRRAQAQRRLSPLHYMQQTALSRQRTPRSHRNEGSLSIESSAKQRDREPKSHTGDLTFPRALGKSDRIPKESGANANGAKAVEPEPPSSPASSIRHTRPQSQTSNISKKRSDPQRREENPSKRAHPALHPMENKGLPQFAEAWNIYMTEAQRVQNQWRATLDTMTETVAEKEEEIQQCTKQLAKQDRIIKNLAAEREEAVAQCSEQESRLSGSELKQQKLQEKLHKYKDHLNNATQEQQKIFSYCRNKYQQMIAEQKVEEQKLRGALEETLATTKDEREKIQNSISEVKSAVQQEIQQLNSTIETLQNNVAEREKEVRREKEYADGLRRELAQSHGLTDERLRLLDEQQKSLLESGKQDRANFQKNMEIYMSEQNQKFQAIFDLLEKRQDTAANNSELVESLRASQEAALRSFIVEIQEQATEDRERTKEATSALKVDTLATQELCCSLGEEVRSLLESQEWEKKYHESIIACRNFIAELELCAEEQQAAQEEIRQLSEERDHLEREVETIAATLEERTNALDNSQREITGFDRDYDRLQQELEEKDRQVEDQNQQLELLKNKMEEKESLLKEKTEAVRVGEQKYNEFVKFEGQKAAQKIAEQVEKDTARFRQQIQVLEQSLHQEQQNREGLEQDLNQAIQKAGDVESIQKAIVSTTALMEKISATIARTEKAEENLSSAFDSWADDHWDVAGLKQILCVVKEHGELVQHGENDGDDPDMQQQSASPDTQVSQQAGPEEDPGRANSKIKNRMQVSRSEGADRVQSLRAENRRVIVQSPFSDEGGDWALPMSVEEEREMRRQVVTPRGILKASPAWQPEVASTTQPTTSQNAQAAGPSRKRTANRTAKAAPLAHSAYNRPVLGVVPEAQISKQLKVEDIESDDEEPAPKRRKASGTVGKKSHSAQHSVSRYEEVHAPPPSASSRLRRAKSIITY